MSADVEIHGVREDIPASHVAAMLFQWCGNEVASFHTTPTLHVALLGTSSAHPGGSRAPRAIEVYRTSPCVVRLTARHADAFTAAVARGFAVWYAANYGREGAHAKMSASGEILR